MIRYRLDDLGWYQFEWLVQSLLKAELGLAVESWGGHADFGRDAFSVGPLGFPTKGVSSNGPFVFQVKFVENANAAGAHYRATLLGAVRKELERIVARIPTSAAAKMEHYVLLTNAPISAGVREQIRRELVEAVPGLNAHLYGGGDICDLLELHPQLRRSFPQLLSLRDLESLLAGC